MVPTINGDESMNIVQSAFNFDCFHGKQPAKRLAAVTTGAIRNASQFWRGSEGADS